MSAFSVNRRRILCLRLPRLPTDRLRRQLSHPAPATSVSAVPAEPTWGVPWVVVGKQNNALRITALDEAAAAIGLEVGLPLANARAICPQVQVFDADDAADQRTLHAIADWCDRFTPLIALAPPDGLFLDVTGCAHLFGGEVMLLRTLRAALQHQGFAVHAAIAATASCASAITMAVDEHVVPAGREAETVSRLLVGTLGADEAITRGLRRAGLKTIGDVAARPPHEIAARFGSAFVTLLQQVLGCDDAPISPRKPPPDFMAEKRFAEPVASDLPIMAALDALAGRLVTIMERHGKGARFLEASFFRTDGAVRTIAVAAGRPVTQTAIVQRLFRERLDALADPLDPGFGFDLIRLAASHVQVVTQEQRDLDSHAHDSDEVSALIDRIAARIGGRRIVAHLPQDTHIPERAEIALPAQHHFAEAAQAAWTPRAENEPPLRPLRMFDPPEPVDVIAEVPDGPPAQFKWRRASHAVIRAEGPERIAMEWWRSQGRTLTRDYFRVEDQTGLRFWLYRDGLFGTETTREDGEPEMPRWFMHGVFA
jgi:protein ImuB